MASGLDALQGWSAIHASSAASCSGGIRTPTWTAPTLGRPRDFLSSDIDVMQ